jgi:hypothetical protein
MHSFRPRVSRKRYLTINGRSVSDRLRRRRPNLGIPRLCRQKQFVGRDSVTCCKRACGKRLTADHPPRRMTADGCQKAAVVQVLRNKNQHRL